MVPCRCLVAGGLALLALNGMLGEALNITSKSQLVDAIAKGEAHLVITEHLDLREAASLLHYYVGSNGAKTPLGVLQATTLLRTIRGDCSGPPATDVAAPALQPLRAGQCIITTTGPFLGDSSPARFFSVWIDNVYLRIERNASHVEVAQEGYAPMFYLAGGQRVWLTRSTVQGDGVPGGNFAAFSLIGRGSGVFITDVLITDITVGARAGVAFCKNCTFAAHNSTFQRVRVVGSNTVSAHLLYLESDETGGMLLGEDISLNYRYARSPSLRVTATSVIYGSTGMTATYRGTEVPLEPVENAPEGLFLAMEGDEQFEYVSEGAPPISADTIPLVPGITPTLLDGSDSEGGAGSMVPSSGSSGIPPALVAVIVAAVALAAVAAAFMLGYAVQRRRKPRAAGGKSESPGGSNPHPSSLAHNALWTGSQAVTKDGHDPGYLLGADRVSDVVRVFNAGSTQVSKRTASTWRMPTPVLPGKTTIASMTTLDLGTAALATRSDAPPLDDATALELTLDRAHQYGCQILGPYLPLGGAERCSGGQGCVQFVRDVTTKKDYAVKFFLQREAFDREAQLYRQEGLKAMMPATIKQCKNEDGTYVGPDGYRFPPFIVIERGESLVGWQRRWEGKIEIATALQALIHIASRLKEMHEAGWVHMDLKPSNVLWLPQQHAWSLIDFGCTAPAGKEAPLAFTPAYAAPEVVAAYEARQCTVLVQPSADIWSFGLIAYEMLTDSLVFKPGTPRDVIADAIMGRTKLPWEAAGGGHEPTVLSRLRAFRSSVMQCLSREAAKRPSIDALLNAWYQVFDVHTTTTLPALHATGRAGQ